MLFEQVVRRGSISAAARAMHLSQPAVTQAVQGVELALGAPLLSRSHTGLKLTKLGLLAIERVSGALHMLRDAISVTGDRSVPSAANEVLWGITATQLDALIAVVEEGAFARAARRSGLARAAVHRSARQLERCIGAELFEATSFGVRPTKDAEKLAVRCRLAIAELTQAQAEIAAALGTGNGATVIGAMPLARSVLVARAVLEFAEMRPDHRISILDGPYESMLTALRQGAADVLVGAIRDPSPAEDILQEHLFDDPLAVVVGRRHALAGRGAPSIAALSRYPWIAPRRDSPLRRHFDTLVARLGAQRIAPIECNSLVAARSMLIASDRLMLSSEHQIYHELKTRQLAALPHPLGIVTRSIGLTTRRDWRPTAVQAQLVEGLRRHARAAAARHNSRSADLKAVR
jgi:LysR family transcriptional regulator, regulator for genes of the gallate degradation pathway